MKLAILVAASVLASTAAMATEVRITTHSAPAYQHTGSTTVIRHDNGMHRGFAHSNHYGYRHEYTGSVAHCTIRTVRKTNDMGVTVTKRVSSC